jgi:hypothetical protein
MKKHNEIKKLDWNKEEVLFIFFMDWELSPYPSKEKKWIEFIPYLSFKVKEIPNPM